MLLNLTFSILFFSLIALFFIPASNRNLLKNISLFSTGSVLVLSCLLLDQFDTNSYYFQYVQNYKIGSEVMNLTFSVGLDGISLFFFILSNFLIFLCVLFVWEETLLKEYAIAAVVSMDDNHELNKARLRISTISDNNIWLRYNNNNVEIKIKHNPTNNGFFKYHLSKMKEAKVIKKLIIST
jgi:hypothetical protein